MDSPLLKLPPLKLPLTPPPQVLLDLCHCRTVGVHGADADGHAAEVRLLMTHILHDLMFVVFGVLPYKVMQDSDHQQQDLSSAWDLNRFNGGLAKCLA